MRIPFVALISLLVETCSFTTLPQSCRKYNANSLGLWPIASDFGRFGRLQPIASVSDSTQDLADMPNVTSKTNSILDETRQPSRYASKRERLEREMLDLSMIPVGSLTSNQVESFTKLMNGWAKEKSVDAALVVENLLKRVVDDLRAGNQRIRVTSRMYTIAIDAWAKAGGFGSAERAQQIHDGMIQMYQASGDPCLAPSHISYGALMNAWKNSPDREATQKSEKLLSDMIDAWKAGNEDLKPEETTVTTLINTYTNPSDHSSVKRAEELFHMMDEFGIPKTAYTYSALQNVYAKSNLPDTGAKAEGILEQMLHLYKEGDMNAKPNIVNFNTVLNALSRKPSRASAERANHLLQLMEAPVSEGGYDVDPDQFSYSLTISACSRCPHKTYGAGLAVMILEKMEARAEKEAIRRKEVSSAAPLSISMNVETYNVVLHALTRCNDSDLTQRAISILERMEKLADGGNELVRPNVRSWNLALTALSRSREKGAASKAEEILNHMLELCQSEKGGNAKPDQFSFSSVLYSYKHSPDAQAAERADDVLRRMERLYDAGQIDDPPDVYHYTIVCAAWAKSRQKRAQDRCEQILAHMIDRHNAGFPGVSPNVKTYNAVLDCMSRDIDEEKAEKLLYHMLNLYRQGDTEAGPNVNSFITLIYILTRSKRQGSGRRAEAVLDRLLEYSRDENPEVLLHSRAFTQIISYYARCKQPDAPNRAESVLYRLVALYKSGMRNMSPPLVAFRRVFDSYAYNKHPDAAIAAVRLLEVMRELRENYGALNLAVNTNVLNSVINACVSSGGESAVLLADKMLGYMERKYAAGSWELQPETKSYELVLYAWSKSSNPERAMRALHVLRRMQEQHRNGNENVTPNKDIFALVIRACTFAYKTIEERQNAFQIATDVLNEMIESEDINVKPSSAAYAGFFQACTRLRIEGSALNLEWAFGHCCKDGLVDDFVLAEFRSACPMPIYKKLLHPILIGHSDSKFPRISMAQLPKEWTRNVSETKA